VIKNLKLENYGSFPVSAVEHLNSSIRNLVLNGKWLEKNPLFSGKPSQSLG